jgi:hypothetical protein
MLNAGATTFWEINPPGCAGSIDFAGCLIADFDKLSNQGTRLVMSMAHGWASGPAAFLMESQPWNRGSLAPDTSYRGDPFPLWE